MLLNVLFALGSLYAQNRADLWQQDLDALESGISARHPKMMTEEFRATIAERIAALRNDVDRLSDRQIAIGIAAVLATFQEMHTSTDLSVVGVPMPRLPVAFRWFSDGLFITAAADANARLIGYRVVRFGNTTAEEAHNALLPFISTENQQWAREISQTYLALPDLLQEAGLIRSAPMVPITLASRSGEEIAVDMTPVTSGYTIPGPLRTYRPEPLYMRSPLYRYWFDFLAESRTLYFKYNQCSEMSTIPFHAFLTEMREARPNWPVERLVVDLRHNTGGGWKYIDDFLRAHKEDLGTGAATYPLGMYAIIGKRTASAAVTSAIMLKKAGFILVGEATGGKPSSWGVIQTFVLPNSRIAITSSTRYVDEPGYYGMTLEPDMPVDFPSSAWWAGHDAFLDAIVNR